MASAARPTLAALTRPFEYMRRQSANESPSPPATAVRTSPRYRASCNVRKPTDSTHADRAAAVGKSGLESHSGTMGAARLPTTTWFGGAMAEEIARLQTVLHQSNAALEEQKKQVAALTAGTARGVGG